MGSHLIDGQFQSDKYPWCKPGFVPLKLTDKRAQDFLWQYAELRRSEDSEFSDDLQTALRSVGYKPMQAVCFVCKQSSSGMTLSQQTAPPTCACCGSACVGGHWSEREP
jgi:hypothetical protein